MIIDIARDFTLTPGPRKIVQGDFSGELFRKQCLEPCFNKCIEKNEKLEVILDGTYGYFDSFLEEAFGGLARIYGVKKVLTTIVFISKEDPSLVEKIIGFIKNSNNEKNK